jgi:hypothetical protein
VTTSERPASAAADPTVAEPRSWSPGIAASALVGVIAMGLAIGIAELLAAVGGWIGGVPFTGVSGVLVGSDVHPVHAGVAEGFAIRTFGHYTTRRH